MPLRWPEACPLPALDVLAALERLLWAELALPCAVLVLVCAVDWRVD